MKKIKINLATYKNRVPILIGIRGENEVRQIDIDFEKWAEIYGEGTVAVVVQRNGDANPYPITVEASDHIASWIISMTDTEKEGKGEAQVSYIVGEAVKRSEIIPFTVKRGLDSDGDVPDPYISWLEQVQATGVLVSEFAETASDAAQASANSAEQARGYASVAKQSVAETLKFTESGDGEIVITINTEV